MKTIKHLLIGIVCLAALSACNEYDGVTITNKSSQAVTFDYDGGNYTLPPGNTRVFKVAWYTPAPTNIRDPAGGTVMVELTGHYEFVDATSIELFVTNLVGIPLNLKADDFIKGTGSDETVLNVPAAGISAYIYTKRPQFRVIEPEYANVHIDYRYYPEIPSMSVVIGP
jgi:hypothetical protein